jgi:hypothetical protein
MICEMCQRTLVIGEWPFCPHGMPERSGGAAMIDDTISGGARYFENLGEQPVFISSKSQLRDELRARGLRENVKHVGVPGTDKSRETQRWI